VPSIRFRLDGGDAASVAARVREAYGPDARVLAVDEVRLGGVGGFFARRYLDVTVDVPETAHTAPPVVPAASTSVSAAAPAAAPSATPPAAPPVGLAALLDSADAADESFSSLGARSQISTQSAGFADVLESLTRTVAAPPTLSPERSASGPVDPPVAPGAMIVVAGLRDDAREVARAVAATRGTALLRIGGSIESDGVTRVDDRIDAVAARAAAVAASRIVVVAWGLGAGDPDYLRADPRLAQLAPDQLWLAVDATRKPEDTAAWVDAVQSIVRVDAAVTVLPVHTATPGSPGVLGLPRGRVGALG